MNAETPEYTMKVQLGLVGNNYNTGWFAVAVKPSFRMRD